MCMCLVTKSFLLGQLHVDFKNISIVALMWLCQQRLQKMAEGSFLGIIRTRTWIIPGNGLKKLLFSLLFAWGHYNIMCLCGQKNTTLNMETKGNCHIRSPIYMTDTTPGGMHFKTWMGEHNFFILQWGKH